MPVVGAQQRPDWLPAAVDELHAVVEQAGAVKVSGLDVRDRAGAVAAIRAVLPSPLSEREGFAPRDTYAPGVYSSSHWPQNQPMCMHHELSYTLQFPRLMAFCCVTPPTTGGVTALADARQVLAALPPDLVARFEQTGWMLTRNYNELLGTPWTQAFGGDRAQVEQYCRDNDIEFEWDASGGLRTRQRRQAVVKHPVTGERCWFNQIAFLNEWTMDPGIREYLTDEFGRDGLPFTTYFGDGTPLTPAMVDQINAVYEQNTVRHTWQRGDLLIVDNVRMAHSREPYDGEREIVVGMGAPATRG
ncbi:hypothetical protein AOZ06_41520 [Kibdelosporangium phytohabitans]|uniref:TauD/TfdA-like domain-containing protein n=1 Tax=Kibdelosporangium phytohabitans TaxID=860235 RepID=A0A0N9IJ11_9PSEU|nr:hypothetical protein AOZ06_41520 [Kibdelosporangium phytohabitans]